LTAADRGFYEVAIAKHAAYVRVYGLATMNNSLCLRDFIEKALAVGRTFIIVDLAHCTGMDSTFMGLLAGAAMSEQNGKSPGVAAVNAGGPLLELLKSVGLTELIFVEPEPFNAPDFEFARLEEPSGEDARLALVRSAHEHLIKLSDHNEEVFGPLVAALEMEMRQRGIKA